MLKQRGNDRFHVVLTWNTCGMFVGYLLSFAFLEHLLSENSIKLTIFSNDSNKQKRRSALIDCIFCW